VPRTTGSLRNGLAVLGEPDFRRYVIGQASSAIGTGMVPIAISFAVLGRGGSASEVGDVFASGTLPIVAFLLIGGVVVDRFGRRRVMVGSDLLRALAQGALGLSLLVGHPPLVAFVVAEALVGTGTAFFTPAIVGLIPQITSASRRQQANTLNAMATFSGNLVGPAISGILVATAGAGWAVVADAASYLISASCLIRLSPVVIERSGETRHFLHELAEGWRDFRSRTWLWVVVGQFSLFHLIVFAPFLVLGAMVARDSLGGAGAWGAILAARVPGARSSRRKVPARSSPAW
jgi:MFS family permease